ncbi:MAG: HGGxSTG domain-containing protein [Bradyrhizobium sp.]
MPWEACGWAASPLSYRLTRAPRCGAKTRAGGACQRPVVQGRRRCRLHGGLSPGAPRGAQNGNYKDGEWTIEAIE